MQICRIGFRYCSKDHDQLATSKPQQSLRKEGLVGAALGSNRWRVTKPLDQEMATSASGKYS